MKVEIDLDMSVDIEPRGLSQTLYVSDSCEPAFEVNESWEDLVKRTMEYYILPGNELMRSDDLESLKDMVIGLEYGVSLFKEKIRYYEEKNKLRSGSSVG